MDFSQCLIAKMEKGTYIIVVNAPDNNNCPALVKFSEVGNSLYVEVMTNSVYIGKTNKQILICASYSMNYNSKSDYIKIDPDKFTKVEVNYTYDDRNRVEKVILNPTECCPPISL